MMQLLVFALVLAVVYAVKAVAIVRDHGALAEKSASFSWAHMRHEDEETAADWATQELAEAKPRVSLGASPYMRHVGA